MACTLSQGDPSFGKVSTADFHISCKAVSIVIARINTNASLMGNFFLMHMQQFLIALGVSNNRYRFSRSSQQNYNERIIDAY